MKTAEQVLYDQGYDEHSILDWEDIKLSMKLYANAKLDEATKFVKLKSINRWPKLDKIEIDTDSIISLKDSI